MLLLALKGLAQSQNLNLAQPWAGLDYIGYSPTAPLRADAISLQTSIAPTKDTIFAGSFRDAAPSVNTLATGLGSIVRVFISNVLKAPNESWTLRGE